MHTSNIYRARGIERKKERERERENVYICVKSGRDRGEKKENNIHMYLHIFTHTHTHTHTHIHTYRRHVHKPPACTQAKKTRGIKVERKRCIFHHYCPCTQSSSWIKNKSNLEESAAWKSKSQKSRRKCCTKTVKISKRVLQKKSKSWTKCCKNMHRAACFMFHVSCSF